MHVKAAEKYYYVERYLFYGTLIPSLREVCISIINARTRRGEHVNPFLSFTGTLFSPSLRLRHVGNNEVLDKQLDNTLGRCIRNVSVFRKRGLTDCGVYATLVERLMTCRTRYDRVRSTAASCF